jgi:hypothetical protein
MEQNSNQIHESSIPMERRVARVPEEVYPYKAGIVGGVLGGLAMIPIALVYGVLSGHGVWYPVNLIAATALRNWQSASTSQLTQFSAIGLVVGLGIHLVVSVLLGLTFAILLPTLPKSPLFWAFVVGPVLWAGATYAALPLLNPVMAQYIDWPSFITANIVYSLVVGLWVERTPKIPAR